MNISWTSDDSSSYIQYDDDSEADQGTDARNSLQEEPDRPPRRSGLLAIDDSDFQALIEILGTDGDRVSLNVRQEAGNRAPDERRSTQDNQPNDRTPMVARDGRNSRKVTPSRADVHESPRVSPKTAREPFSSIRQASNRATTPPNYGTRNHMRQTSPTAVCIDRAPRTSNLAPLGTAEPMTSNQSPRLKANNGFTQSKQQLGTSLTNAKDQIADLRIRLQVLKNEVKEFAPHLYSRAFDTSDPNQHQSAGTNDLLSGQTQRPNAKGKEKAAMPSLFLNGDRRKSGDGISSLSEEEAKNALANVCRLLGLHPSELTTPFSRNDSPDPLAPPSNLPDMIRAMKLVSDLDELVWRRNADTRDYQPGPSGSRPSYNIYDEENIQAILDRVRLWERTARSRAGRRTDHH